MMSVWVAAACLGGPPAGRHTVAAEPDRPPTHNHVPELAAYLDRVQIAEPVVYRQLAVYPILLEGDVRLRGQWLTLDAAVARGVLSVTEKPGGGSVPEVTVENRSRTDHVFIMTGEIISGGKQTRTVRSDVIVAPGQRINLSVFCVEARRWEGGKDFSGGKMLLPQSIQKELRKGADQSRVWSEVARNNAALEAENATGSLELALRSDRVREKLGEVRRRIVPGVPEGTMGFIFVNRGRPLGAEFFGDDELARSLLPKLLDSYAVDCVVIGPIWPRRESPKDHNAAIEYFRRVCRAGSRRSQTPGSGAGMKTRSGGLLGDGASLAGTLVHYGVQIQDRVIPLPGPRRLSPQQQGLNAPDSQQRR
jgi:hypothetical protein